jgi:signal transduction histidine kinase
VHGHAIAWLSSVPLCVLLLVDSRAAAVWCGICFLATLFFCALEGLGIPVPIRYPLRWHSTVTGAGFLGLTVFLTTLGITFEVGRRRAFRGMQEALQNLSRANQQLTHMNAEKNEMLGIAAHDLKNPLNGILGFARLIATKDSASPERVKVDANEIINASTHMRSIVSNLLDVHAIEEGKFPIENHLCDLAELAGAAVENQEPQAGAKEITLHFIRPVEPVPAKGDHRAILQILDNLISNAIKFSPAKKHVFVRLKMGTEEVSLEVQDQGPGLSAEDHARLFEKFAVLSARPTAGESSNGLGLSIVKRLAEAMESKVSCSSVPGAGATFVFTMPTVSIANPSGPQYETASGSFHPPAEIPAPPVLR